MAFVFIVFTMASFPVQKVNAQDTLHFGQSVDEFEFTIPTDYDHKKQIDKFTKQVKNSKGTDYYNNDINSKNFSKTSNKLIPGKTYKVKIFPILDTVKSEDCLAFLKQQNAFLVGAQGLTLLQSMKNDKFPLGTRIVSFDEKESLWKDDDGNFRVPYIHHLSNGNWWFALGNFNYTLGKERYLLCFSEK
ncbi:MAG: hypothetical protein WC264_00800 [Candidatus Paceibacterota bacterium]